MSAILDALRKSEAERNHKAATSRPLTETIYHTALPHRRSHLPWWIAVLLLGNIFFAAYLFWRDRPEPLDVLVAVESPVQTRVSERHVSPPEPILRQPSQVGSEHLVPEPPSVQQSTASPDSPLVSRAKESVEREDRVAREGISVTETEPETEPEAVPSLSRLPEAFRQRVPSMQFNSHIYSENPSGRRVMINNVYMKEGQQFEGMELVRITRSGVVFQMDGQQFRVDVITGWVNG